MKKKVGNFIEVRRQPEYLLKYICGMKHFLVLISSLCFTFCATAQHDYPDSGFTNKAEAKNKFNKDGLKDGKWLEYVDTAEGADEEGSVVMPPTEDSAAPIYSFVVYKAGEMYGIARDYYSNGQLKAVYHFKDGKANGLNKLYYPNGNMEAEYPCIDDKENGVEILYYKTGVLKSKTTYKMGVAGDSIKYDASGNEIKQLPHQSQ